MTNDKQVPSNEQEKKENTNASNETKQQSNADNTKQTTSPIFAIRLMLYLYRGIAALFSLLFRCIDFCLHLGKRHWKIVLITVFVVFPLLFSLLYLVVEQASFPSVDAQLITGAKNSIHKSEAVKGTLFSQAIYHRLDRELHTFFGWSVNDLIVSPTAWLDNRAHRQEGVIFATMMLERFFSTRVAKYGKGEEENIHLKKARTTYFVYQPGKFWLPSSESQYKKGISLMKQYEKELRAGKAKYNFRTDDMYALFKLLISEDFLGEPLGRLGDKNFDSFTKADDAVYYAQGVVLVVRDVITVLYHLYPELMRKGSQDNFEKAFHDMDAIAAFNPWIVLNGNHDSMLPDHRSKEAAYLYNLTERLRDIANSLNR